MNSADKYGTQKIMGIGMENHVKRLIRGAMGRDI